MGKFIITLLSTIFLSSIAQGAVLVDTGSPPVGEGGLTLCGWLSSASPCKQSLAIKVSLAETTNITDIQSFFLKSNQESDLTLSLYNDVNNLPGQELYSRLLNINELYYHWDGLSGLNWAIDAGDYWVTFEVREGQKFFGSLTTGAPNRLPMAVMTLGVANGDWFNLPDSEYYAALILQGTPITAVPEPESYAMILTGLGVIGLVTRRRKPTQV